MLMVKLFGISPYFLATKFPGCGDSMDEVDGLQFPSAYQRGDPYKRALDEKFSIETCHS